MLIERLLVQRTSQHPRDKKASPETFWRGSYYFNSSVSVLFDRHHYVVIDHLIGHGGYLALDST